MSDSETKGRCRQQLEAWFANNISSVPRYSWMIADAIDRLAADVEAIKAKVDAVSPEDVAHLVESEKAFAELFAEQRDAAIRERDEARAEVERLKAELDARSAGGNRPEKLDSSTAAPQPAAPAPGWLTEREQHALRHILAADVEPVIRSILARAGSPPVVVVPALGLAAYRFDSPFSSGEYRAGYREACFAHRHAMDKAGVAWKEVPRE